VRSKEDVSSETLRERTWQWYTADVLTRLKPRAKQVFCNTRWHEDDLAGRILDRDAKDWTILKLEMENTREDDPLHRAIGERLWAEWFTPEMVERAKQDPSSWTALYQQNPSPEGGGEFKKGWVEFYDTPPNRKNTTNLIIVDPANEKSRTSDFTAMWVLGMGGDGNAYVLDVVRDRLNLAERTEMLFRLHKKYRPVEVRYERYGMMGDIDHIKLEMDRLSYRFRIREVKGQVKKEDRIRRLIPWFKDGKVVFPRELVYTNLAGKSRLGADFY
jgi:predicted phage terminase large subunit-like protein